MSASPVLIVGARSDIGRALARAYAEAGRPLLLAARGSDRLEADAADLRIRHGVAVRLIELDILDDAAQQSAVEQLDPFPGTVVMVVGLLGDQAVAERDAAAADRVMRTNYNAPALMLDRIAARMAARGSGTIVGISSVAGDRGRASNYAYGSAKAGFTAFLSGLRNRLAKAGVHVVTVKPGFVDTRMTEGMKLPPLVTAQPEEVARAIVAAETRKRDVVYVRPVWGLIMLIIRNIPERVFKRLKL